MRISLLLLGCTLLLPARGVAQRTPPAPAPQASPVSPARLAAARELLELMHVQEAALAGMTVALDQQSQSNPALAPYRATMEEWARDLFDSEEARNAFAAVYAEAFSEPELREMIVFFRSPAGQRLAASQGALALQGAKVGQRLAETHQADLMARLGRVEKKSPRD